MIPMWLKIKVPRQDGRSTTLWLPLFILWMFLVLLFVICLPVWLIVSFVLRQMGYGWRGLTVVSLILETLSHLQGLVIDVKSKNETVYLKFL